MPDSLLPTEPSRRADAARLELIRLRVEDGVTLESIYERVTETAADVLKVERVGIWLLVDEGQALRCVDLFERSKIKHSSGVTLQVSAFPRYFAALRQRKTVPAELAEVDRRTSELARAYIAPLGIASMLDAAIFVGGQVTGVVCHEHVGSPREWTTEERDFASSMADLVALKIRAAEMEDVRVAMLSQQNQIAEARRMGTLAEMSASVAHDFNNVLSAIIGCARTITDSPNCTPLILEAAHHIVSAGHRGTALAQELMGFARPGPGSSQIVRPAEVVQAQLPLLQGAAGHRHPVRLNVRTDSGRTFIDPEQLERAILNLVTNARDAMIDGNTIEVTVDTVMEDESGKPRQFVMIEVKDRGVGITPEVQARMFDPFFTTKPVGQGTGVGLAIVHQIISYAGGHVKVESVPGSGTAIRLYLPTVSSD